jgi:hypothetical protein
MMDAVDSEPATEPDGTAAQARLETRQHAPMRKRRMHCSEAMATRFGMERVSIAARRNGRVSRRRQKTRTAIHGRREKSWS